MQHDSAAPSVPSSVAAATPTMISTTNSTATSTTPTRPNHGHGDPPRERPQPPRTTSDDASAFPSSPSSFITASESLMLSPDVVEQVNHRHPTTRADPASLISMPAFVPLVVFLNNDREALQQTLQRQREDRLRIELTGRNGDGDSVYFEVSMMDGFFNQNPDCPLCWEVHFNHDDTTDISISNFIKTLEELELRVGGVVVLPLEMATVSTEESAEDAGFDPARLNEPQMGYIRFHSPNVQVYGRVGPILSDDYMNTLPQEERDLTVPEFVQFLENHRTNDPNNTMLLSELEIDFVVFRQSHISGILSVLQSMGVQTE